MPKRGLSANAAVYCREGLFCIFLDPDTRAKTRAHTLTNPEDPA